MVSNCIYCGVEFESTRKGHNACSKKCSTRNAPHAKESRRKWREKNKDYFKNYQKNWRVDDHVSVYYLPEHHYVGVTDRLSRRLTEHRAKGRLTDGYEILGKFERHVDAHYLETLLHMRGYLGYQFNRKLKTKEELQS